MENNEDRNGGVQVTVTLGAEKFAPVQYHSFDVGPFSLTVTTRKGESIEEAAARGMASLYAVQKRDFEARSKAFLERVRAAALLAAQGKGTR